MRSVAASVIARRARRVACVLLLYGSGAGCSAGLADDLLSRHGDWEVRRRGSGAERMCSATTTAVGPTGVGTGGATGQVHVTAWPAGAIKSEISIVIGRDVGPLTDVTAEIGAAGFALLADGDRAYVHDLQEELRLLQAMRRGRSMTVTATTVAGGRVQSIYSLAGLTAAVEAVASACE